MFGQAGCDAHSIPPPYWGKGASAVPIEARPTSYIKAILVHFTINIILRVIFFLLTGDYEVQIFFLRLGVLFSKLIFQAPKYSRVIILFFPSPK